MKEFVTAVEANEDKAEGNAEGWIEFKVDGEVCKAKRPMPGQIAYLTASMHKRTPLDQQISGVINFCMSIMDQESGAFLSEKLLDNEDPFDLPQIQDIIEYLVEEWSGRPTEPSAASSPSQESDGSASTPSTPDEETFSTSASIAS